MIDIPYTVDELVDATTALVRVNGLDDGCYIRPLVYLGYGEMGLNPIPCPVNVSIAAWPWGTYLGDEGVANGVSTKISSWRRHDPNAVPTAAKGTGMYVNSSLAKVEALDAGADLGKVHVDDVAEFLLRVIGNPDRSGVPFDEDPLVFFGVSEVFRVHYFARL